MYILLMWWFEGEWSPKIHTFKYIVLTFREGLGGMAKVEEYNIESRL